MAALWEVTVKIRVVTADYASREGAMSLVQPYMDQLKLSGITVTDAVHLSSYGTQNGDSNEQ